MKQKTNPPLPFSKLFSHKSIDMSTKKKKKKKRTACHDSCPHKNLSDDQRPLQPCAVCVMFFDDMSFNGCSAYKRFIEPNTYMKKDGTKEIRVRPNANVLSEMMKEGEGVWSSKRKYWQALAEVNDRMKDYSVFKEQVIIQKSKRTKQNKTKTKTRSSFFVCFCVTLLGFVLFLLCFDLDSF